MTDIVERLRAYRHGDAAHPDVMREAADEIVRLRAVLEKISTLHHSNSSAASIAQSALDTMKALRDSD